MTAQDKIDEQAARSSRADTQLATMVKGATPAIARRLPRFLATEGKAEQMAAIALDTVMQSAALRRCSAQSIVRGIMLASEYGLAIDGVQGHAYLVPYKVKGVETAQFQIGYRGLVELMYRTEAWESVNADVVTASDAFDFEQGTTPFLKHKRALERRGAPGGKSEGGTRIAAYAIAYPKGGGVPTFVVLSEEDVLEHRRASKAYAYNPGESIWKKYPDVAWCKSALRELSKTVAMATDKSALLRKAAVMDERSEKEPEIVDAEIVAEEPQPPSDEPPPGEAIDWETGKKV